MWKRFTGRAQQAVYAAQNEAKERGSREVDTGHLLLGLLEDGSQACRLLQAVGIEPARLRKETLSRLTQGEAGSNGGETFSRACKNAIDLGYDEARDLGDTYIGTEHLILGLLKEKEGVAAQALAHIGFELENARLAVVAFRQNDVASVDEHPKSPDHEEPKVMWQRFTERARKIVFYAHEEAQKFGEDYVSTEHLLLGLVRETDNVSTRVLERLGVSNNRIRVEVERHLPRGDARPSQDMTLTPRAKRVIDLAFYEAKELNNNYIGTEHLLLGLVREGDGLAGRVLAKLGVDLERARLEVAAMQDALQAEGSAPIASGNPAPPPDLTPFAWTAFESEAQAALFRAKETASGLGETHLTPFHMLLALLEDPDSDAMRALRKAGLEPDALRAEIDRERTWAFDAPETLQLSPNGRRVMDVATIEARMLSSERLTSGHILLGLARGNPDGVGQVLSRLGVRLNRLRDAVQDLDKAAGKQPNEADPPANAEGV